MNTSAIRILNDTEVKRCLGLPDAIKLMRSAFTQLYEGDASVPVRTSMRLTDLGMTSLIMPAYLSKSRSLGMKWISVLHKTDTRPVGSSAATAIMFNPETGRVTGIMAAHELTTIRTAAGAAYAADVLAPEHASRVAIFGVGHIAETQLEALTCVRPIKKAFVFSRSKDTSSTFARKMGRRLEIDCIPMPPRSEIAQAEIVITATNSSEPVFDDDEIAEVVHINGVGSYRPDMIEVPSETVLRSLVVADHLESVLEEAGDVIQPVNRGSLQANQIRQLGDRRIRRTEQTPVTFFKSVGNAVQDVICGQFVLERAEELGFGQLVSL